MQLRKIVAVLLGISLLIGAWGTGVQAKKTVKEVGAEKSQDAPSIEKVQGSKYTVGVERVGLIPGDPTAWLQLGGSSDGVDLKMIEEGANKWRLNPADIDKFVPEKSEGKSFKAWKIELNGEDDPKEYALADLLNGVFEFEGEGGLTISAVFEEVDPLAEGQEEVTITFKDGGNKPKEVETVDRRINAKGDESLSVDEFIGWAEEKVVEGETTYNGCYTPEELDAKLFSANTTFVKMCSVKFVVAEGDKDKFKKEGRPTSDLVRVIKGGKVEEPAYELSDDYKENYTVEFHGSDGKVDFTTHPIDKNEVLRAVVKENSDAPAEEKVVVTFDLDQDKNGTIDEAEERLKITVTSADGRLTPDQVKEVNKKFDKKGKNTVWKVGEGEAAKEINIADHNFTESVTVKGGYEESDTPADEKQFTITLKSGEGADAKTLTIKVSKDKGLTEENNQKIQEFIIENTPEGQKFVSWKDADGNEHQDLTALTLDKDLTLTAQFVNKDKEAKTLNIIFKIGDKPQAFEVKEGESLATADVKTLKEFLTANTPEGKKFSKWVNAADATKEYKEGSTFTEDTTFEARFVDAAEVETITITIVDKDGREQTKEIEKSDAALTQKDLDELKTAIGMTPEEAKNAKWQLTEDLMDENGKVIQKAGEELTDDQLLKLNIKRDKNLKFKLYSGKDKTPNDKPSKEETVTVTLDAGKGKLKYGTDPKFKEGKTSFELKKGEKLSSISKRGESGYIFKEWKVVNGGGIFEDGTTISDKKLRSTAITADIELQAVWDKRRTSRDPGRKPGKPSGNIQENNEKPAYRGKDVVYTPGPAMFPNLANQGQAQVPGQPVAGAAVAETGETNYTPYVLLLLAAAALAIGAVKKFKG